MSDDTHPVAEELEIEICSCEESLYLREFAKRVLEIAGGEKTGWADMAALFDEFDIDAYFKQVADLEEVTHAIQEKQKEGYFCTEEELQEAKRAREEAGKED